MSMKLSLSIVGLKVDENMKRLNFVKEKLGLLRRSELLYYQIELDPIKELSIPLTNQARKL